MARLFTSGFELNSTTAGVEWTTKNSSPSIQSTIFRGGGLALQIAAPAAGTKKGLGYTFASAAGAGPYYFRAYLNVSQLPGGADAEIIAVANAANGTTQVRVNMTQTGTLQLFNASSGTQIGSDTAALNTDTVNPQWYRIELLVNNTGGAGAAVITMLVDGVTVATSSAQTISNLLSFHVGANLQSGATSSGTWYFDDVAINDSTGAAQTSYPGPGHVKLLAPNAAGDVNTFATQTGGTAGAGNNYTRVMEIPPDDATSFNGSNTLNQEDLFNMVDCGLLNTDFIKVVCVMARFRNNVADATTAIKFEIEKTGSGTKTLSSAIVLNSTTWKTNSTAAPATPPLTLYNDPDGNAWTPVTLNSMQLGYKITTGGTNRIEVTGLYAQIDYVQGVVGKTVAAMQAINRANTY